MKRAHIVRVLACVALSMAFFQPDAGAADIVFAPKAFFDYGDGSVEISGTLTGDDVLYKNNTVVVACYRDRRECLTYSIEQIAPNSVGRLPSPIIFPITAWNAFEVIATEDVSVLDCRKTTITLERKRRSAVWVEEPINQARAACKNAATKVYKWTIENPPWVTRK